MQLSLASICLFAELLLFYVLLKHYMVSSHLIHKSLILSVFKRYTNESFFLLSLIRTMTLGKTQFLFLQSEYNHSCLSCPYHFRDTRWIGKITQMGLYTHSHACTWKTQGSALSPSGNTQCKSQRRCRINEIADFVIPLAESIPDFMQYAVIYLDC